MAAHPDNHPLHLLPCSLSLLGVMSETLIMSDCDTDSPDIHNKETKRRERQRDHGEGRGKKQQRNIFFLHINSIATKSPMF